MAIPIPDFDELANIGFIDHEEQMRAIKAALIKVWNERGAADASMIEGSLSSQMGGIAAGPYVKNLQRAIGSLDVSSES